MVVSAMDRHQTKTNRCIPHELSPVSQLAMFVSALFKPHDLVEVRCIRSASSEPTSVPLVVERAWLSPQQLLEQYSTFACLNEAGANIYFGVNPRARRGGAKDDVSVVRCIWADIDDVCPDEALERWSGIVPIPSIAVASGNGTHAYWRLNSDYSTSRTDDRATFESLLKNLYRDLGADSTQDVSRLLRLPGFFNVKRGKSPCELLTCDSSRQYSLSAFEYWMKPAPDVANQLVSVSRAYLPTDHDTRRIRGLIRHLDVPVDNRSQRDFAVLCGLLRLGLDSATIWSLVQGHSKFEDGGKRYFAITLENVLRRLEARE